MVTVFDLSYVFSYIYFQ